MTVSDVMISVLGFISGFCAIYIGVGGGLFIMGFLQSVVPLNSLEVLQLTLTSGFLTAVPNSFIFYFKKFLIKSVIFPIVSIGLGVAFLSSLIATQMPSFGIRLSLWLIVGLMLVLPLILKMSRGVIHQALIPISGVVVGISSGLAGLGGGLVLSPLFHETRRISVPRISANICAVMSFILFFSLMGQWVGTQFLLHSSLLWWRTFFILLISAWIGSLTGHYANQRLQVSNRRFWIRLAVFVVFVKVSLEMWNQEVL